MTLKTLLNRFCCFSSRGDFEKKRNHEKGPQSIQRLFFTLDKKAEFTAFFMKHEGSQVVIYFGEATECYPYPDHRCLVEREGDGLYGYVLEGHGIGSNKKPSSNLKSAVDRVFFDCERFTGGEIVTVVVNE